MIPLNGYVVDANVLYRIQEKIISVTSLQSTYKKLYLSPITVFEILAKIYPDNFSKQQEIAKICLDNFEILPDPNIFLAEAWQLIKTNSESQEYWIDVLKNFIDTKSYKDFEKISEEYKKQKNESEIDFVSSIDEGKNEIIPGYKEFRAQGKTLQPTKKELELFATRMLMPDSLIQIILAIYERTIRVAEKMKKIQLQRIITPQQLLNVMPFINFYTLIRVAYIIHFYQRPPKLNDFADVEIMTYLGINCRILTFDEKWIDIAKIVGLQTHVLKPTF